MSLLREFYESVYRTNANLKDIPCNPFKINVHFKEQRLKKTVPMVFWKVLLFYEGLIFLVLEVKKTYFVFAFGSRTSKLSR